MLLVHEKIAERLLVLDNKKAADHWSNGYKEKVL